MPLDTLHQAVLTTSRHLALTVREDRADKDGCRLIADGVRRTFSMRIVAISPQMSQLALTVKYHGVLRDRATASEFIAQLERLLDPVLTPRVAGSHRAS